MIARLRACIILIAMIVALMALPAITIAQTITNHSNSGQSLKLAIEDFEFESSEFDKDYLKDIGTSLAHSLAVAMLPFLDQVQVISRGSMWRAFEKLPHLKKDRKNLFHPDVMNELDVKIKVNARYTRFVDKIAVDVTLRNIDQNYSTKPVKLQTVYADIHSSNILLVLQNLAKSVVNGAKEISSSRQIGSNTETVRRILIGCFTVDGNPRSEAGELFRSGISDALTEIYDNSPSIIMIKLEANDDNCNGNVQPDKLMQRLNANSILIANIAGEQRENSSSFKIVVEPTLILRSNPLKNNHASSSFQIPTIRGGEEQFAIFRVKVASRIASYLNSIHLKKSGKQQSSDLEAARNLSKSISGRDADILITEVKEKLNEGKSDAATSLLLGFLSNKSNSGMSAQQSAELRYMLAWIDFDQRNFVSAKDHLRTAIKDLESDHNEFGSKPLYFGLKSLLALNYFALNVREPSVRKLGVNEYRTLILSQFLRESLMRETKGNLSTEHKQYFRFSREEEGSPSNFVSSVSNIFLNEGDDESVEATLDLLSGSSPVLYDTLAYRYAGDMSWRAQDSLYRGEYDAAIKIARKIDTMRGNRENAELATLSKKIRVDVAIFRHRDTFDGKRIRSSDKLNLRSELAQEAIANVYDFLDVTNNFYDIALHRLNLIELYIGLGQFEMATDILENMRIESANRRSTVNLGPYSEPQVTAMMDLFEIIIGTLERKNADSNLLKEISLFETSLDGFVFGTWWDFTELNGYLRDGVPGKNEIPVNDVLVITNLISLLEGSSPVQDAIQQKK
ncbi:MAG: hypothetical protein V7727_03320 [Sneathiella sp.]